MKIHYFDDGIYEHFCPGCNLLHMIAVDKPFDNGQQWSFNNDMKKPTFSPSINIVGRCHYFIRDGYIEYCMDSQHKLAGKRIELPDLR
ncbi:DUF6527 family protein [Acinetobacter sp. CFCC 10889]|uniref:DUF6527 family protein n=1 Tax=Acinetobacter sp. CFCC 10889 TaxID=1775557 RepID=UPI000DD0DB26|nr:DUF6527 family protein [Acinetobacter sp. CFCC 10889]